MTEYLLLFRNAASPQGYDAASVDFDAAVPLWGAWIAQIVAEGKFVRSEPLTFEGSVVRPGNTHKGPHIEQNQALAGFLICRAESQADAERIAAGCPIFQYPNPSVEIRAIIPFS
ncbi:MAG: YciI family protein [Bacteroidia bacterium]|nr:YciI family protein [Bacteroidia bacterium]